MDKPKRIARSKMGDYTINTMQIGLDRYETAIKLENRDWIIVQVDKDRVRATVAHNYWVQFCIDKPISAYDVVEGQAKIF